MSENSEKYRRAIAGFSAVVDAVAPDKWSSRSPCEDWTASHIVGHVIGGTQMISVAQTGQAPEYDALAAAGDDPAASFAQARDLALSTLTDEYLAKKVPSPMGEMPVDQMLGMFLTNDVLIHTWDLAQAVGDLLVRHLDLNAAPRNGLHPDASFAVVDRNNSASIDF